MIRDLLIPALQERYPYIPFAFQNSPQPFARARCQCTELGELEIHDDEEEATVVLTRITHSHFNPYTKMTQASRDAWVTATVLDHLDALFSDRLLLYFLSSDRHQCGSIRYEDPIDRLSPVPNMEQYKSYVWSGPVASA